MTTLILMKPLVYSQKYPWMATHRQCATGTGNATTFAAYRHSPEAVTVLLHDGAALGGDADGDTFEAVHSLLGSRHDDTLGRAMSTLTCWPAPTAMTDWQAKRGTTSCTATTSPAAATPAGTTASTSPPSMGLTHSPRPILSSDARIDGVRIKLKRN